MPSYKVLKKGFFGGCSYDPDGKRSVLHTSKKFPMKGKTEQVPDWLEAIKGETAAQAIARETAEAKAREADEVKAKADQNDIAEASFLGEGESTSTVETL